MKIVESLLDKLAEKLNKHVQGRRRNQAYRDADEKGSSFSVESMISESLTDLITMNFTLPVDGDNERAQWIDDVADNYVNTTLKKSMALGFLSGDSVTVPSYNGRSIDNVVVDASGFEILSAQGDEITSLVYVIDERKDKSGARWQLLQLIELVPDNNGTYSNVYRLYVAKNNTLMDGVSPAGSVASPWFGEYDGDEWSIPGVDRLLIGRYKSHTIDPYAPNTKKGVPICFGSSHAIREIHYLLDQMHAEFELSEKAIIASKTAFKKRFNDDGTSSTMMPRGADRLFMSIQGGDADNPTIHDWSPDIRFEPYRAALEKQLQLVEKTVGVSSGIISDPSNVSYENVDNVRKSQQKTMSFVNASRKVAQNMLDDLLYAWDVLDNYYGITPQGRWVPQYNWSDEYVETFSDKQNAILAGEAIGAFDAADYRAFITNEPPDVAKERVSEIQANKATTIPAFDLGA